MSKTKLDITTALAENFGRKLSEPAVKLYVMALGCITDEQATKAASIAVQKSKFMPAAAELIELARTGGVSYEAQAVIAFEQLEAALGANKPSMMPALVAAIVNQLGGFQLLHGLPLTDFNTWKRKEFLAAYTALVRESPERVAALAGPQSEISLAFAGTLKQLPTREDDAKTEDTNRQKLLALKEVQ